MAKDTGGHGSDPDNSSSQDLLNRAKYNRSGRLAKGELERMRQELRRQANPPAANRPITSVTGSTIPPASPGKIGEWTPESARARKGGTFGT